jgi:multidrug efflux pump subunit AcrB
LRGGAHVRDGFAPQQNVVRVDGARSGLMTVLKSGATPTHAIVQGVKDKLREVAARLPTSLMILPRRAAVVKNAYTVIGWRLPEAAHVHRY